LSIDYKIEIVEEDAIDWDEPTVITGFPGPGFVGETVAMFIIDSLKMREIGHVESELIPPMLVVMGPNLRPPFRIHASENADVVVMVDNQPIPMEHHRALARRLMDWLTGKGVKEIMAVDGLPLPDETLEGRVIGYSTSRETLSRLNGYGVLPLTGGAVTGINAALLEICREWGVPWTGLLAPTRRIGSPNWRGVASIIEVLNGMLDLGVDTSVIKRGGAETVEQSLIKTREPRKGGILGALRRRVG